MAAARARCVAPAALQGQAAASASAATAAAPAPSPATTQAQPDLVFDLEGVDTKIHVFGVEHTHPQAHVAEFIYRLRPSALVVETAVTPEHGSRPGNTITCRDRMIEGPQAFYMRMFCQVAGALQELEEQGQDALGSELWRQVSHGQFRGEQLAYVAALACGAVIVAGDRPKDITYRRLYGLSSIEQLDEGYGHQAIANYKYVLDQIKGRCASGASASTSTSRSSGNGSGGAHEHGEEHWVQHVMMTEREAVMCRVAHDAALRQLPALAVSAPPFADSAPQQTPGAGRTRSGDVVMVVGSAHLEGLAALWRTGRWREVLGGEGVTLLGSPLLDVPPATSVPDTQVGVRRGLLHALLQLSVTEEVLSDLETTLGLLPDRHQPVFDAVTEIYGSYRAQLACLPREMLDEVWQGCLIAPSEAEPPVRTDPWEVLQPLRDNRPVHGGTACAEEVVMLVRGLNFQLDE